MFDIKNNEKNKSAVILSPERSEWVSRSHVTSVEIVVNDGAKTKRYSAKRDLYGDFAYAQPLKMTASASCHKAHKRRFIFNLIRRSLEKFFKKNFRDDTLFCFGFAKVLALALIFSIITISKSLADNITSGTCGDDCTWSFSNGTLKIIGDIQDYDDGRDTPWRKAGLGSNIKTIDASESTGFGTCSFEDLIEVTKVIMPKQINGIPGETFRNCAKLENLEFPDGLQYIGDHALSIMYKLKSITIPDSATVIDSSIFEESSNINTIYCKGNLSICRNNLAKAGINYLTVLTAPEEQCQNSSNYYYTGTECTNRPENPDDLMCTGGYAKLKNNCVDPLKTFAKKRWTPAEANEWLHDGNDNFVIITFKK